MRRTLIQALLILDYVMSHTNTFYQVGIVARVNDALFSDFTYISSFKGSCSDYFKGNAKEHLSAIGKDNDIFISISTKPDGKRVIMFGQY